MWLYYISRLCSLRTGNWGLFPVCRKKVYWSQWFLMKSAQTTPFTFWGKNSPAPKVRAKFRLGLKNQFGSCFQENFTPMWCHQPLLRSTCGTHRAIYPCKVSRKYSSYMHNWGKPKMSVPLLHSLWCSPYLARSKAPVSLASLLLGHSWGFIQITDRRCTGLDVSVGLKHHGVHSLKILMVFIPTY